MNEPEINEKSENKFYNILIIACIIGIAIVLGLVLSNRSQESFTELYFEEHAELPKEIEIGKDYSFKFSIHNLENKQMVYNYRIYEEQFKTINGNLTLISQKVIAENNVLLNHNETASIYHAFSINEDFEKALIKVELPEKEQEIHFWVSRKEEL